MICQRRFAREEKAGLLVFRAALRRLDVIALALPDDAGWRLQPCPQVRAWCLVAGRKAVRDAS